LVTSRVPLQPDYTTGYHYDARTKAERSWRYQRR